MHRPSTVRRLLHLVNRVAQADQKSIPWTQQKSRQFHVQTKLNTDGVFKELTEQRVLTPWITALRSRQAQDGKGAEPSEPGKPMRRTLEPKRMSDSYHRVILPLAKDPWLSDTYLNADGHIRLGAIFMDLDALSGVIAYKHTGDSVTTVTAAFDRITIKHPLTEICDLELSGQVTYATGRSSMEISLQVAKDPGPDGVRGEDDILLNCNCTMVSLDPVTRKPTNIHPLTIETPEERRLYERGEQNSQRRREQANTSLVKYTPNDEESDLIHNIWQKHIEFDDPNNLLTKPGNVHFIESTRIQTTQIMQPQYRNRHNFMVFGGFLLKQAFELAFCCAASFSHQRPSFLSLDPSTFENPVPVGSVLYLSARVVYTDPPLVPGVGEVAEQDSSRTRLHVRVDSKVRDVAHGATKPTGTFNYTFVVDRDIKVMPRTYTEFMMYIDARRRLKKVDRTLVDIRTKGNVTE
ncbi:Thioesterase/thiol ester dehydrase-isomerase [Eremomyces bilateralis CBS 781.70]|uniref:Thioesterase/thiol ester dehydrase-isomerase n=1 Tax=Eremomyces bilateralis CBS 781.70 TaxID=1392243 RepID=A0A6G1G8Q5_9PEZI|nr:Thioesterase/thiol ester dehydrase-isomerase [Eremomyces bilateralis CBS 781.70]KAF1814424.1 Thioesterase/thiol ester dehydrase-isomerase [Eremomyces bilateralis CBS 781.70]